MTALLLVLAMAGLPKDPPPPEQRPPQTYCRGPVDAETGRPTVCAVPGRVSEACCIEWCSSPRGKRPACALPQS